MAKQHDNCFGFLRFVFALIIVIAHLRVISAIPELECTRFLSLIVNRTAFFVISGFLILLSYNHSKSIGHFFEKRARRILPAYFLIILLCAFGLVFFSDYSAHDYFTHPMWRKYLAGNLCFMNFIEPCLPGVFMNDDLFSDCAVNASLWTLKVEVGFYLIVPLLVWCLRRTKKPWILLVTLYFLSVLWHEGFYYLADTTGNRLYLFLGHQLPGCMSYFAAGMLAYCYKDIFLKYKHPIAAVALLVVIVEKLFGVEYLLPAGNAALLLWCAFTLKRLSAVESWGNLSYGMYLYHAPLLKVLLTIGFFSQMNVWLASTIYIAIVIMLSYLSYNLFERRIMHK